MADYGIVLQTLKLKSEIDRAGSEEVSEQLTGALHKIVKQASKAIETLDNGGWSMISHDITRLGSNLVITFLIHR